MFGAAPRKILDLTKRNPILDPLLAKMKSRLVGQEEAAQVLVDMVSTHLAGFSATNRPAGNALFLGGTGTGKTHAVEVLCEGLVGDARACIKIDCAEFQHSHEIAKLIGSPPGYLRPSGDPTPADARADKQLPQRRHAIECSIV